MRATGPVLQHREQQAAREAARLERELNAMFHRLAAKAPEARTAAMRDIEALAERRGWPHLVQLAKAQKASYDDYWQRQLVTTTVQVQQTQVMSMTPFTTSLGVGTPVTLQLPRVRSASVGTTVVLPAGTGR